LRMRPQGSQKRGGVVSEYVPRGQPSLATSENQPVATSENPPGTWLPTPVRSRGPRPRRRPRRGHNLNLGGKAQGWSWVGAPALGGGQSRCQCRGVSHSCGVRLEFPKKGCPLQGRQRNQLPARCAAVCPTGDVLVPAPGRSTKSSKWCWAIPGWCTLALLGMCTGKGPAGKVATGQKKSRGWFSFQVPGRGSRRPRLAARTYATAGGQGGGARLAVNKKSSMGKGRQGQGARGTTWARGAGRVGMRGNPESQNPKGMGDKNIRKMDGSGSRARASNRGPRVAPPRGGPGCPHPVVHGAVLGGLGGPPDDMTLLRESGHKGGEAPERERSKPNVPGYGYRVPIITV
jgi:hypothetical protein